MLDAPALARSPQWFPTAIDPASGAVRFVRLDEAAYAAASFLDGRLTTSGVETAEAEAGTVEAAAAALSIRTRFIFHTGHAGSTLLSRLTGAHPRLFALREPELLRTLAQDYGRCDPTLTAVLDRRADTLLRIWSRTWRPEQTPVLKATSFVSEEAARLLGTSETTSAVLMFTTPPAYLRSILGAPNSRVESRVLAPARLSRLARRLHADPWPLEAMSEGETVAMGWLAETAALHAAAKRWPEKIEWLNFDQFLASPQAGLALCLKRFGVDATAEEMASILAGPLMRQYSKDPEHAYDARLRGAVMAQAEQAHGEEVRRGMDWLGRAAMAHPLAREVLETAARVKLKPSLPA